MEWFGRMKRRETVNRRCPGETSYLLGQFFVRGHPELSSLSREYTEYAGRDGVKGCLRFLNVDYDALHFHTGVAKINIFIVLFWEGGGGHKKEYSVYAFDNVDNYGRPLTETQHIFWEK